MIEVYKGRDGKFYWRARARNGKIVADGSQGYKSKSNLKKGFSAFLLTLNIWGVKLKNPIILGYHNNLPVYGEDFT